MKKSFYWYGKKQKWDAMYVLAKGFAGPTIGCQICGVFVPKKLKYNLCHVNPGGELDP
jgi:hypothetical protein